MKVAILTFQFAHNYGALLQAYALKRYLKSQGHTVELTPYYPDWAQREYAISPFAKGISMRKRVRFTLQYTKRKRLADSFTEFQKDALKLKSSFDTEDELETYLNNFDLVFFGSDQIWNDKITGDTAAYYGGDIKPDRVSYAASLGTKTLTPIQEKYVKKYLPRFKAISVRETTSEEMLKPIVDKPIVAVTDPVFLLRSEEWEAVCQPANITGNFMFLYFLKDDHELLRYAKEYADNNGLTIYEVHPTLAQFHEGCKPLTEIGPREFIWLIKNAECVCTNSFHATSFSVIFRKKLLHIPNEVSPERTMALLSYLNLDTGKKPNGLPLYKLDACDYTHLNEVIEASKGFIQQVVNE